MTLHRRGEREVLTIFIAVFGKKKRGKTKTIEMLIHELRSMNVRVGVAKHVHHADFTIDKPGKDSWRYAEAGAERIVVVSPSEIAEIEKTTRSHDPEDLIKRFSNSSIEIVLMEGFFELYSKDDRVAKLIVGTSNEDVQDLLAQCRGRVLGCVATGENQSINLEGNYEVFRLSSDARRISEMILSLKKDMDISNRDYV